MGTDGEEDPLVSNMHTLKHVCDFALSKIQELKKGSGREIRSKSMTVKQDLELVDSIIKLHIELSSMLMGVILSIENGNIDNAITFFKRVQTINIDNVVKIYSKASADGSYHKIIKQMNEGYNDKNI